MLRRFRLEEPESLAEVSELLGRFGDSAKIYADILVHRLIPDDVFTSTEGRTDSLRRALERQQ